MMVDHNVEDEFLSGRAGRRERGRELKDGKRRK